METPLQEYSASHRYLLAAAARQAGFANPVAVDLDELRNPLIKAARRCELLPLDGVLVRDWDPAARRTGPGTSLGMQLYEIEGVRFAWVRFAFSFNHDAEGLDFVAVDRKDYRRLYRIALRCRRDAEPPSRPPVLPASQLETLWKNTIGYLEPANLARIKAYGGRARRGVLMTGAPGNGKTMACRWLWEACRQRRWEWRIVTPDAYRAARGGCNPVLAVKELFSVERAGIVFFDDMDIALRDRETVHETDDQAVFLGALDGIEVNQGVVFVFTTNCALDLIDRAFKRPGRIDVVLHFQEPSAELRRRLIEGWHADIRAHLDLPAVVASTDGCSFAEIEELRNLLVMHYLDTGTWDWGKALKQFSANRHELAARPSHGLGFGVLSGNGRRDSTDRDDG